MISARDLPLLPVFVAVAESGSFTAAARELRLAKSVVSQHIRTLEERCGIRLIERSTRRLHLTHAGTIVLDSAKHVLTSVRSLDQVVAEQRGAPAGGLRITSPVELVLAGVVAPITVELLRQHPSLRVELIVDDAVRDLIKDGLDVALRLGPLTDSSYVVRRLGTELEIIVASASVAERWTDLDGPSRLASAYWVAHSGLRLRSSWSFRSSQGARAQVNVDVRVVTNSTATMKDLIVDGAGFGVLPAHIVRADIESGRLRHVCPGWYHRRLWLHALLPTRRPPPQVRAFLSALADAVRPLGFAS